MTRTIKALTRLLLSGIVTLVVLAALLVGLVMTFRVRRPPAPPAGAKVSLPWGAVDLDEMGIDADVGLQASIAESLRSETPQEFDRDNDGIREYAVLALSGGGSNGAFGAGLLCAWTKAGDRPEFKVVTGISTGSLQSVAAFLGADYDGMLRTIFTTYDTPQIYTKRSYLSLALGYSFYDTAPLRARIDEHITPEVVKAIAARHRRGYRLFVATSNMDTSELVIWDIGRIANSGRPDARAHICKILLASCSVPVAFPPVYFEVEADGKHCHEMHADGGLFASVFLRGFMLDLADAFEDAGIDGKKTEFSLYVIRNGVSIDKPERETVNPHMLSIAAASVRELSEVGTSASLFRVYALSKFYGVPFNIAAIPESYDGPTDMIVFDRAMMRRLFKFGYDRLLANECWATSLPGMDADEVEAIEDESKGLNPSPTPS